jgi:hypothetical protein
MGNGGITEVESINGDTRKIALHLSNGIIDKYIFFKDILGLSIHAPTSDGHKRMKTIYISMKDTLHIWIDEL